MVKQFAVLSAPDADRGGSLSAAARAFGATEGWPHPADLRIPGPGFSELIVWGADAGDVIDADRHEACVLLGRGNFDLVGARVTPRTLLDRVAASGPAALGEIAAPCSAVLAFGDPARFVASTDPVGLSAVYHADREGVGVAGSSSRLLAAILECPMDEDALCAFATLGAYVGADTPFQLVQRLAGGKAVELGLRGLTVSDYAHPPAPQSGIRDAETATRDGVAAVRAGVEACVAAYPEVSMELSGGLDSRLILAALLAGDHRPVEGLTLGESAHPDVVVASSLARRFGMRHRRVDLAGLARLSPAEALALLDSAGRRRDYSGNCASLGVLDWVERSAGALPRFSGQNGELARGYYYPFQPRWPQSTDVLARALVRWRLMANERAPGELFSPEVRAAGQRRAELKTQEFLEGTGRDWLSATDLLYLNWRMQRWVGCDWTAAAQDRVILAPFFHRRYITWALAAPPPLKRGSKLLARVLHEMSPELARMPTAGGEPPLRVFHPRVSDRVTHARRTAHKVTAKARQRARPRTKAPVGAPVLAALALAAMADERTGLERVAALPFVSREHVERLVERRTAAPATVGLLAALRGLVLDASLSAQRS